MEKVNFIVNISDLLEIIGSRKELELDENISIPDMESRGKLNGRLIFNNAGDRIILKGNLKLPVLLICGRCTEPFDYFIDCEIFEQYISSNDFEKYKEEELSYFPLEGDEIELGEVIRQNLIVALPLIPVCREECKGICPTCNKNLNISTCNCKKEEIDSRWLPLLEIKEKQKRGGN